MIFQLVAPLLDFAISTTNTLASPAGLRHAHRRYITSGAIQAHGRTAANLAFERERSDNAMAKYSKRLGGMGKSTLAAWVTKQILTTKVSGEAASERAKRAEEGRG